MSLLPGSWREWSVEKPTSLTVGVLDGVHRGHRSLLDHLDSDLLRTVLTFEPHPIEVLRPGTTPRLITTLDERVALLEGVGVGCIGALDLSDIKELSPEEFVEEILVARLRAAHVVVGEDFRFGKDRSGGANLLTEVGPDLGFRVDVRPLVGESGEVISSSRIRGLVEQGRVADANDLLGSTFSLTNTVIDGDKRGRQIGFPTANLRPPDRKLLPADGVYACLATVGDTTYHAAVNVGVRPTFGGGQRLIEAFLLDFDSDIYGNDLTLRFVQYLRPELAFDGVEALVSQMHSDVEQARGILAAEAPRM